MSTPSIRSAARPAPRRPAPSRRPRRRARGAQPPHGGPGGRRRRRGARCPRRRRRPGPDHRRGRRRHRGRRPPPAVVEPSSRAHRVGRRRSSSRCLTAAVRGRNVFVPLVEERRRGGEAAAEDAAAGRRPGRHPGRRPPARTYGRPAAQRSAAALLPAPAVTQVVEVPGPTTVCHRAGPGPHGHHGSARSRSTASPTRSRWWPWSPCWTRTETPFPRGTAHRTARRRSSSTASSTSSTRTRCSSSYFRYIDLGRGDRGRSTEGVDEQQDAVDVPVRQLAVDGPGGDEHRPRPPLGRTPPHLHPARGAVAVRATATALRRPGCLTR